MCQEFGEYETLYGAVFCASFFLSIALSAAILILSKGKYDQWNRRR